MGSNRLIDTSLCTVGARSHSNERLWVFILDCVVAARRINCFSGCADDVRQSPIISTYSSCSLLFPTSHYCCYFNLAGTNCVCMCGLRGPRHTLSLRPSVRLSLECNYQVCVFFPVLNLLCVRAQRFMSKKPGIFVLKVTVMDTGRDFILYYVRTFGSPVAGVALMDPAFLHYYGIFYFYGCA